MALWIHTFISLTPFIDSRVLEATTEKALLPVGASHVLYYEDTCSRALATDLEWVALLQSQWGPGGLDLQMKVPGARPCPRFKSQIPAQLQYIPGKMAALGETPTVTRLY